MASPQHLCPGSQFWSWSKFLVGRISPSTRAKSEKATDPPFLVIFWQNGKSTQMGSSLLLPKTQIYKTVAKETGHHSSSTRIYKLARRRRLCGTFASPPAPFACPLTHAGARLCITEGFYLFGVPH